MLKKVQEKIWAPSFLGDVRRELQRTPEFWFSRPAAGAQAHMDSHVQTTISIQLDGRKVWRLGFMERRTTTVLGSAYGDGKRYAQPGEEWRPLYNVSLDPGDVLFIPPGFVHETFNEGEGCALSLTHQFSTPMPWKLYKTFWPRVRRTGDIGEVLPMVLRLMSLGQQQQERELQQESMQLAKQLKSCEGSGDAVQCSADVRSTAEKRARALAGKLDASRDGELDRKEIGREYDDALVWFDDNNDKKLDIEEYVAGFCDWAMTDAAAFAETPKKFFRAHYDMDEKDRRDVVKYTQKILAQGTTPDDKTSEL